ncbi:MAG: aminotransferase class III-fold pyridoxal phosphate-dependent enzyme [Pseudomonadaceae bacterium]|nr:aminotransferase class III-fold pyridoxal phosphate-dependent enzyme [Pseudomonadaceae bacterium]
MSHWPFVPAARSIDIRSAHGSVLVTADGQEIIDAAGGAIVVNIGHGNTEVADAINQATRDVTYVVPPWLTPGRHALADELTQHWLPDGFEHIHITSGGSEAVEAAVKLALQYHSARGNLEKTQILTRSLSYHGTTVATTGLSGHASRKRGLEHALPGNPSCATPYLLRCPDADPARYYRDDLLASIERVGGHRIAAFVAEPITGSSGGAQIPHDSYWADVRAICDEHDILWIADEVMTGFGRTGKNFGFQHWSATPDLLVAGKGLAGGYAPLGGVYAPNRIAQPISDAGFAVMFHTFGAHPAACAGAAKVLEILRRDKLVERAATMGERLGAALRARLHDHPNVAEVRGRGLLQAIEVVADRSSLEPFPIEQGISNRIVGEALKRGVFFYGGGTGDVRDIVCMGPPFVVSEIQLDTVVDVLEASIDAAVASPP